MMESGNNHASPDNIWHQQQISGGEQQKKQFYMNHYQPMQHGFDLQREITTQPPSTPDNVHFARDMNGPYVKIYYSDKEYELFDRNQLQQPPQPGVQENQVYGVDRFNNYLTNQMPFQAASPQPMMVHQQQSQQQQAKSSVIHHLVTANLGPGKFEFGTFGGHNNSNNNNSTYAPTTAATSSAPLNISIPSLIEHVNVNSSTSSNFSSNNNNSNNNTNNGASIASELSPHQLITSSKVNPTAASSPPLPTPPPSSHPPSTLAPSTHSNNSSNKKQRIVAEVKPMRMSYSDVVSKNGASAQIPISNNGTNSSSSMGHSNSNSSSPNTTMPITSNKTSKTKYQLTTAMTASNGSFEKKYHEISDKNRKSPTSPVASGCMSNSCAQVEARKLQPNAVKIEKPSSPSSMQSANTSQSQNAKKKKPQAKESVNTKPTASRQEVLRNKYVTDSDEQSSPTQSENEDDDEEPSAAYYDVHRNVYQGEHHKVEKIRSHKKSKPTSNAINAPNTSVSNSGAVSKKSERNQKRMSAKSSNRKQKHKFLEKLIASCIEYIYIFVKWLWLLIYDVSYLSTGILWDRISLCYQYAMQGVSYVRRELRGNPGRVFIAWSKSTWKKFDSKFDKKSKWAFWRWIFKKQSSGENAKDYCKDGKLPKTAEEAMKSLLNCKEKDAYSILGVSPDCPQEQIKKHYKKIAVLVHPDKNKQAGAEEAFKVLQRSFEFIGEPESRKQYDENLAKALHTEKAFNELNDLLIQLQTKISEAANTIRCSSCCFRHPRKPTGRKPFAARECSTCKIRHAAREGDIWAETTFFGLRWKYLALMEGNVYDITEWALCQRGALSHLQANSCVVQYKIVLGGNQQNQNQGDQKERDRFAKKEAPMHEPQEDFFLNNIYAGQGPQHQHQNARRRFKKN